MLGIASRPLHAQEWPARTVTIIVPFSAGGTADLFARLLATHMQQKFGGSFIVENRVGAGGNIGAGAVAKAPNDGYTLLLGTVSTHAINQFMYSNMPFDPAKDFPAGQPDRALAERAGGQSENSRRRPRPSSSRISRPIRTS